VHVVDSCCGGRHEPSDRKPSRSRADHSAIGLSGPISHTILDYANRMRYRVNDDLVERHAREMQARSSYDCWNSLSDRDQELWRHMARLDLAP
jgi:hypothetical protein